MVYECKGHAGIRKRRMLPSNHIFISTNHDTSLKNRRDQKPKPQINLLYYMNKIYENTILRNN